MKIKILNFVGDFKRTREGGSPQYYKEGDVVTHRGRTFIASKTIAGLSPSLGENAGWLSLSDSQVLYEMEEEPFISKVGDEWIDVSTGVRYKRISNNSNEIWVEI